MKKVTIYTDGGCEGNPGPGGWGAVLEFNGKEKEISGGVAATTNNRMEITAAIEAFTALKEPCEVDIYTDSEYLRDGITMWIHGWKARGWKKKIKNVDLWQKLDRVVQTHKTKWHWVRGHAGTPGNERCDRLAAAEIKKLRGKYSKEQLAEELRKWQEQVANNGQPELLTESAADINP